MQRRAFVRLIGGGVVMAAGVSAAGCSSGMPAEAVAAWQGPRAETELRRWILSHAILAPHSHNLQSWRVDLRTPGEITLYCDLARLLPVTDPHGRQIMMSHGTFIELLDIAARERGHRTEVQLFPRGSYGSGPIDDRPVARIQLIADPSVPKDPLFAQILQRRTNRNAYDAARPVPAAAWQAMAAAVAPHDARSDIRFGHTGTASAEQVARQREIANQAWKIELLTPPAMLESFKVMRIGAAEIARHRDGLSVTSPMLQAMTKVGLFDRSKPLAADSYGARSEIEGFAAKIASTPGFIWMVSRGNRRETQVNAGRAYVRVQLAATAQGLAMHPLSQALQEYPEQAEPYAAIHRLLGAPQPEQTVQMWARVGYAEPVASPAPRRGVDAHLITG